MVLTLIPYQGDLFTWMENSLSLVTYCTRKCEFLCNKFIKKLDILKYINYTYDGCI